MALSPQDELILNVIAKSQANLKQDLSELASNDAPAVVLSMYSSMLVSFSKLRAGYSCVSQIERVDPSDISPERLRNMVEAMNAALGGDDDE